MNKPIVLGVAGGTGSGKTTFADKIKDSFPSDTTILCHDFYYKSFSDLSLQERKKQNFDHPDSFDTSLMVQDIIELVNRRPIKRPVYSFSEFTRLPETVTVLPTKLIIIEGILIFDSKEIRDLCDIKIFVDTDADERLIRRILRDVKERGRTLDSVIDQYLATVKPMHDQFVEPSKKHADIIVPLGGYNLVALEMVIDRVNTMITNRL